MLTTLLCADATQAPAHAQLHAPESVLYFETHDVPALLAAYGKAPMVQTVMDPEVQAAFAKVLEGTEFQPSQAIGDVLRGLGAPDSAAQDPQGFAHTALASLRHVSFSMTVDAEVAATLAENTSRRGKLAVDLMAIATAVDHYAIQNGGSYPDTLEPLVAQDVQGQTYLNRDELPLDPWGNAFVYEPAVDDRPMRVLSFGADGLPGGEGDDADVDSIAILEGGFSIGGDDPGNPVGAVLVVDFADEPSAWAASDFLAGILGNRNIQDEGDASGSSLSNYRGGPLGDAWTRVDGARFVAGFGLETVARLDGRIANAGSAVTAATSAVAHAFAPLPEGAAAGTPVVEGRLRLSALMELATRLGETNQGASVGMLGSVLGLCPEEGALRMRLVGDRFITEIASAATDAESAWTGTSAVPETILDIVPPEAIGAFATSISPAAMHASLLATLGEREDALDRLGAFETANGFSLADDVFGALGQGGAVYLLPIAGILTLPGVAIALDVENEEALARGLRGLFAYLETWSEGALRHKEKPYRKVPILTLTFGDLASELPIAVSPSFAIVNGKLLITVESLRMKREIKRLAKLEEATRHAAFAAGKAYPASAVSALYMDWAAFINGVYDGAKGALGMAGMVTGAGGGGLGFDPGDLPPADLLTKRFRPTTFWAVRSGDVMLRRNEASFGPETWLGLVGGGVGVFLGVRSTLAQLEGPGGTLEPTESAVSGDAAEAAASPVDETRSRLKFLRSRLTVYRLEHGRYPATLDGLETPSENYPQGFLDGNPLAVDAWDRALHYESNEDGSTFLLWSSGADGVDAHGQGDDLSPR